MIGARAGEPLQVAAVVPARIGGVVAGDGAAPGEPAAVVRRVAVRVPVRHHEVDPLRRERAVRRRLRERFESRAGRRLRDLATRRAAATRRDRERACRERTSSDLPESAAPVSSSKKWRPPGRSRPGRCRPAAARPEAGSARRGSVARRARPPRGLPRLVLRRRRPAPALRSTGTRPRRSWKCAMTPEPSASTSSTRRVDRRKVLHGSTPDRRPRRGHRRRRCDRSARRIPRVARTHDCSTGMRRRAERHRDRAVVASGPFRGRGSSEVFR